MDAVDRLLLDEQKRPLTVLEAKQIHSGEISVLGTIVSISEMYVVEQLTGNGKAYKNAKCIQLEDTERPEGVILYGDDILSVRAGEMVEIFGENKVENQRQNNRSKKKNTVLHAKSIKYINHKELVITPTDIITFERFAKLPGCQICRLVAMFAPNVVRYGPAKLEILRSIVGGIEKGKIRGRINTLLVRDPGTAKSTLSRETVEIKPNSRYVSGPHSSTRTITAIMDKDNEGLTLRLCAIPLSRGAICAVNEITSFSLEEQSRLLDILEEGEIPLNKQGMHRRIPSPTTIIATANPMQSTWKNKQTVSNDEIAIAKTLVDRFDQIFVFRDDMSFLQTQEFVKEMTKIRKRKPHNYNFLRKYLIYASSIDVTISPEAEQMLNDFWIKAKVGGLLKIRGYNTLFRLAEAQAKLQLKSQVDADIANQTMESIQIMMVQYGQTIKPVNNPRDVTINSFIEILESSKAPIAVAELHKIACRRDDQISAYLGPNHNVRDNKKLRNVVDILLNRRDVKKVNDNPIVLQFLGDLSDLRDSGPNENILRESV